MDQSKLVFPFVRSSGAQPPMISRQDAHVLTSQLIPTGLRSPSGDIPTLTSGGSDPSPGNHAVTPHYSASQCNFSSWYRDESSTEWLDSAKGAFNNAVEGLSKGLSSGECDMIWLQGKNSMSDVQAALIEAQAKYVSRAGKSKVRSLLASCSTRVAYYAPIFDTLSQHYPEYTSLAWGAFKFFFIVMINHEELLAEVARAITNIANVLPRTNLVCELYPTKEMQSGLADVYAKIIEFVLETVKWYNKTKLQHAIAAVVNPYKLRFKAIVDEIAERSIRIDELANTAVKAELRDVHLKVSTLYEENVFLRNDFLRMREDFHFMRQTMMESRMLQSEMLFHQQGQDSLLLEWQTENLRQFLSSVNTTYGSADEMLAFGRSMRNRRRLRTPTQMPRAEISKLEGWASSQQSSFLVAQSNGIKSSSIDFAMDFLDIIIEAGVPIVYALAVGYNDSPTLIGVLQSLVLQVLSLDTESTPGMLQSIPM
ncbi:hypothetical protein F5Y15DRAFT_403337 [Xylariaceae sp. FL0016]|nr:hypothetical protein F5Y15DRAFT_403337 [Xylariaceae sp. FL0016]